VSAVGRTRRPSSSTLTREITSGRTERMPDEPSSDLEAAIGRGLELKDRSNMQPSIDYFTALLREYPGNPYVLYEIGGAYDTAGDAERARSYYESAMNGGLAGDTLRRCLIQYGSTLRNLEQFDASLAALGRAEEQFPESDSVRLFHALSLHAAGRSDAAVAELLVLAADRILTPEVARYEAALRGNAEYLMELDSGAGV
jgi:tetratricopeptide (TPR) repeat protein